MIANLFIRKHKVALIAIVALLGLGALALRYWVFVPGMEACSEDVEQSVPGHGAYDAKVLENVCDGIVGSDTMSVVLVSRASKRNVAVFVYGRKGADPDLSRQDVGPTVRWLGENRLAISIDKVSYVVKKRDEVDGVKIEYHIGAVEYK